MIAVHRLIAALALAFATQAQADYLPDPKAAETALRTSAAVAQARSQLAAQTLRSESLRLGREEWTVAADLAQRRVETSPGDDFTEWGMALSRPLRLPGRAEADRSLAGALTAHAEASLGEALHESGRQLLALWFDWLNAASEARAWLGQQQLSEQQLETVDKRIRLGDAPRAERVSAQAALAQARMQRQQAAGREQQARSRLLAQFPNLPVAADDVLPKPALPAGSAEAHVDAVLEHNHELARARRQAEALSAEAKQLASRRGLDPNVGVFYKNERGGDEHLLGLNLGLTLPGGARRSDQQAAEQLATAAHEAAIRLEQRLRLEARADFEAAFAQVTSWEEADRAAQALAESARLAARAYELGEGSLEQVLLARRLAQEGLLQAQQAQLAALAANARLKLDTHQLWPLDVDGDQDHIHL